MIDQSPRRLPHLAMAALLLAGLSPLAQAAGRIPTSDEYEDLMHADYQRSRGLVDRNFKLLRAYVADELMYLRGGGFFDGFFVGGDEYVEETQLDPHFYPILPQKTVNNLVYIYDDVAVITSHGGSWKGSSTVPAELRKSGWRPWDQAPGGGGGGGGGNLGGTGNLRMYKYEDGRWKLSYYAGGGNRPVSVEAQTKVTEEEVKERTAKAGKAGASVVDLKMPNVPKTSPLDAKGKAVMDVERARLDAYIARDYAKLRAGMGAGVIFNHLGKRLLGPDAVIGALQAETQFKPVSYTIGEPVVCQFHGMSVALLGYRLTYKTSNETFDTFTYSIYHNNNNKWEFIGGTNASTRVQTVMQDPDSLRAKKG